MARIAIYAGHGGSDPGAVANGLRESDFNLAISNATTGVLRGWGYTVFNNRTTDVNRSITRDANFANENRVDAVVEIHLNSNPGTPATGSEAFVSIRDTGRARTLASAILRRLESLGFRNRGVFTNVNGTGQDTFGILRLTNMPAVLLECAFINNPQDMARLDINSMAIAIAESVREVFPLSGGGSGGGGSGGGGSGTGGMGAYPGFLIRQGSTGEFVRQIQHCLNRVAQSQGSSIRLNEDGVFGPLTQAAVINFQRANGLAADGIVGPMTWSSLSQRCTAAQGIMPPYPGTAIRLGEQSESVRRIQRCINRVSQSQVALGRVNEDGVFGQTTLCAVTVFQRIMGLTADGVVGPITWASLTSQCGAA